MRRCLHGAAGPPHVTATVSRRMESSRRRRVSSSNPSRSFRFLIVLVLRSFIVEPFAIPSNSMMPTLLTGDFILVNKFDYGIRLR